MCVMTRGLADYVSELDESGALHFVQRALADRVDPQQILEQARDGMSRVGQRFSDGEYFIPELVFSGEILKQIVHELEPHLKGAGGSLRAPQIVLGTVAGDIHDIGKNLVKFMLDVSGFGVLDLGVDVPPQRFVESVRESGSNVVALSGFLTLAFKSMRETIEALRDAGLRENVRVMVGGGQIDEQISRHIGADGYGNNATDAVRLAKTWLEGVS
jgi:trimethylamine corrinoid protein